MLQDCSENVFRRWCCYKEHLLSIFPLAGSSFYSASLCSGGDSALPPFLEQFARGPLLWQHLPAWCGGSVTILLCFPPSRAASLLPAAEVVLAGAWLVILSEIFCRLRIMMAKKKLIFFIIGFLLFPKELMPFKKQRLSPPNWCLRCCCKVVSPQECLVGYKSGGSIKCLRAWSAKVRSLIPLATSFA